MAQSQTPARVGSNGTRHLWIAFLVMAGFFMVAPLAIYPVFLM